MSDDVRPELGHLRCPTLVLWGARDNQLPLVDGFEFARRLDAPLRVIADCGHLLIGERPGRLRGGDRKLPPFQPKRSVENAWLGRWVILAVSGCGAAW